MSHDHNHAHTGAGTTLILATLLTLGFAAVEAGVGLWAGSLALVADAGHMVNDAAALALAAGATWLARRPTSLRHSYGLGRAEFIAALINSLGLLVLVAWPTVSAVEPLQGPQDRQGGAVCDPAHRPTPASTAAKPRVSRVARMRVVPAPVWAWL